jgi:amino acid transporter
MAKIHPKYATPHAALIVQFVVSAILVVINFAGGAHVQEAFQRLLSLAVVLQLVPFLYMFAALVKFGWNGDTSGRYGRGPLLTSGVSGFVTTSLGIALVFFPAQQITSLVSYEVWMFGGTIFFVGLAAFFFFVYGRRKTRLETIYVGTGLETRPAERSSAR